VHRTLKARAERAGMSRSDHLLREVTVLSRQMSWDELFDEIDEQDPAPAVIVLDASAVVELVVEPESMTGRL
jgi:hypothetical protein